MNQDERSVTSQDKSGEPRPVSPAGPTPTPLKCRCGSVVSVAPTKHRERRDGLVVTCPQCGVVAKYKLREYDITKWPPAEGDDVDDGGGREWKT